MGVKHLPNIETNEFGTPYLRSAFEEVRKNASFEILCYVNADIIFFDDLLRSIQRIPFKQFLIIGRRTNVNILHTVDFSNEGWGEYLKNQARMHGTLAGVSWIDYFIFTPGLDLKEFPPFVVGRPTWDNWFIFNARKQGIEVVDITSTNLAIHQNHDYSHIPNGKGKSWDGPESKINNRYYKEQVKNNSFCGTFFDANYILTSQILIPALTLRHIRQRIITTSNFKPQYKSLNILITAFTKQYRLFKSLIKKIL